MPMVIWKFWHPVSDQPRNMPVTHPSHSQHSLSAQAATVAFGPARALTSYVRRLYLHRYQGRSRYPWLAFLVDVSLFFIASGLVIAALWFARLPLPKPGVGIALAAPPLVSGAPTPLQATVRSIDGKPHENIRLWWRLPTGAQILEAHPPLSSDGTVFLGTILPGQDVSSRIMARVFLPPGANADITLSVLYEDERGELQFIGSERRPVVATALVAEVPVEFREVAVTPQGTVLPLRIENRTNESLPSVHVTLRSSPLEAGEQIPMGNIGPHEVRWMYLPVQAANGKAFAIGGMARMSWIVGAAGRDLASGSWQAAVVADQPFPSFPQSLVARLHQDNSVFVAGAAADTTLWVVHPLLEPSVRSLPLSAGTSTVRLPSLTDSPSSNHEWFVVPSRTRSDDLRILGPATMGVSVIGFPFETQVRYRSSAGDQLGVGPHPPRVGEETRYWVFWTVGPVDNALHNVTVETNLPPGVTATGNVSTAEGGAFTFTGSKVTWTLPRVGPEFAETPVTQVTTGFEISVIPQPNQAGSVLTLIQGSSARATDLQTTLVFEASSDAKTTQLPEDGPENIANGSVQPAVE